MRSGRPAAWSRYACVRRPNGGYGGSTRPATPAGTNGLKLTIQISAPTGDTADLARLWRELARHATRMACALDPDTEVSVPQQPAPS